MLLTCYQLLAVRVADCDLGCGVGRQDVLGREEVYIVLCLRDWAGCSPSSVHLDFPDLAKDGWAWRRCMR